MRLVAAAGYDLRTPMTRMRLRAEFLPDEEREKWLKDLDELDRIADRAIRLVREEIDEDTATIAIRRRCLRYLGQPNGHAAIDDHRASRHEGRPVGKQEKGCLRNLLCIRHSLHWMQICDEIQNGRIPLSSAWRDRAARQKCIDTHAICGVVGCQRPH